MKTRRTGSVLSLSKTRCKKKLRMGTVKWGRRILFVGSLFLILQLGNIIYSNTWKSETDYSSEDHDLDEQIHRHGRKLLSEGVVWEQCHFEKAHTPHAFLPLYIFLIFLLFVAIAIICDDFFVPSLEAISERLNLSEDVAGATFMAAGSSAPELFTSVAGVGVESDVGVGTIVGSAMFNILIIVALSAVLAGQTLNLDWRPLFRDAFVYGLSVSIFIGFAWDGMFQWWEALIILLLYVAYIAIMKFNPYLMKLLAKIECKWCRNESRIEPNEGVEDAAVHNVSEEEAQMNHEQCRKSSTHSIHRHQFIHSHRGELAGSFANRRRSINHSIESSGSHISGGTHRSEHKHHFLPHIEPASEHAHPHIEATINEQSSNASSKSTGGMSNASASSSIEEAVLVLIPFLPAIRATPPDPKIAREEGKLGWVKFVLKWILFVLSFPFVVMFTWTIPNCSENRKWYVVTSSFLMSIFWIAVISFAMVTLVARVGCILNIDQFVMGLVVVAIGTSVPDCLSSILVARDGFGDMAVSNAIGSNVFDINLGLGLPFLIRIAVQAGRPFMLISDASVAAGYVLNPHVKFGFLLLLILLITIVTLTVFRFRLNKWTGFCFIVIYVLFLIYAFIQELLPVCNKGQKC